MRIVLLILSTITLFDLGIMLILSYNHLWQLETLLPVLNLISIRKFIMCFYLYCSIFKKVL